MRSDQDTVQDNSHNLVVRDEEAGLRLDRFLMGRFPNQSRAQVQRWIELECCQVNGGSYRPGKLVKLGDHISVSIPAPAPDHAQPQNIALAILFEDEDLIVIDKPAGMVVHPAAGHADGTLVNALLAHCLN